MLTTIRNAFFVLTLLSLVSPIQAHANNVLDAPMWDVVGVTRSQMLPSAAATANPIEVEPGTLPVRWPNNGSLVKAYNKKGQPKRREQQQVDIPQITPMAAPAGI